jgi:SAM-dependent methyltransferase
MDYGTPEAYEELIGPRFAPIADALIHRAQLAKGEHTLELGAGTGLLTRRIAPAIGPGGSLCATDLSRPMLEVARRTTQGDGLTFLVVDYSRQLPFLDTTFDVVLSSPTYVQNSQDSMNEVARVLRPGGRFALVMWGPYYGEVRMMSAARRALGLSRFPPAAPGRAVHRLGRAGFRPVERIDFDLAHRRAAGRGVRRDRGRRLARPRLDGDADRGRASALAGCGGRRLARGSSGADLP